MTKKNIFSGAIILTVAGFISNVLAFMYRIFISNALGAEGMGLYHLVISVHMLAWSITCSGFTTTISKLTAQENAKNQYGNMRKILIQSIAITLSLGVIIALSIYFFADIIAVRFFQEYRIALPLRILAVAIPFMAVTSCIRGYIYGLQNMVLPAINQVLEQVFKMAIVFLMFTFFAPMGIDHASAAAVVGIVAQELFSFAFLSIALRRQKSKADISTHSLSWHTTFCLILPMALPLTLNHITGSLFYTFESALIPQRLQVGGMPSAEAMTIFGKLMGMAVPLIYFPTAFLTSLSITLVPAVSEASAMGSDVKRTLSKSILIASLIGHGVAGALIAFSREFGIVIYNHDIGNMLIFLGIVCPLLYMRIVLSGILNGMGLQTFILKNSLLSSAISIGFIYFLMPLMGVHAFTLGWLVSLAGVYALEIGRLQEHTKLKLEFFKWFVIPTISITAAGLLTRLTVTRLAFIESGTLPGLIASVLLLSVLYIIFIIATELLSISEIRKSIKQPHHN